MLIANAFQAHRLEFLCWGCIQRKGKRVNSHAYGECVLNAAAAFALQNGMQENQLNSFKPFWVYGPRSASRCTLRVQRECLCKECDNSTSVWEDNLSKQFGKPRIFQTKKTKFGDVYLIDVTELVLLMQVFRGAMMSIDIAHMALCREECTCKHYTRHVLLTMYNLAKLHSYICKTFGDRFDSTQKYLSALEEARSKTKQLKPTVFYTTEYTHVHQLEYPLIAIEPDIGPVIYAQIPPYYIAIPTIDENAEEIADRQMKGLITGVNAELHYNRYPKFYDENPTAREWKESLVNCRPILVFPNGNPCCIHV